jgi:Lon protease-like protein
VDEHADGEAYELPMFPLGQPLVPTGLLPLHVFEPRYRTMAEHLVVDRSDGPRAAEFGVVLIARGSEVGGDDVRTDLGTVARLIQAQRFDDGRWALVAVGQRRIRVVEWLPDDPFPRARVVDWPDPDEDVPDELRRGTVATLRRVLALASELGAENADPTVDISDDPLIAGYQVAALGPFGPLDRQRLLAASGPTERLRLAGEELDHQMTLLEEGLRLSDDPDDFGPTPP